MSLRQLLCFGASLSAFYLGTALMGVAQTTDSASTAAPISPAVTKAVAKLNFKQQLLARYGQRDTARAVINLFARRQGGGAVWLVSTGIAMARIATTPTSQTTFNGVVTEEEYSAAPALLVGTIFGGYGASKLIRFSNSRLEQTLQSYDEGKGLPKWVSRRLKRRFFTSPIIEYKDVKAKPAK